jgi:formiminoglutamase
MKINEFVKPYTLTREYSDSELGFYIKSRVKEKSLKNNVLLIGVSNLKGETTYIDKLRESFYSLSAISIEKSVIDYGNIVSLSNVDRTEAFCHLSKIVVENNATLIILSDNNDVIIDFINEDKPDCKLSYVTPAIAKDDMLCAKFFEGKIPQLSFIGWQSHFSHLSFISRYKDIDNLSLGELRDDIMDAEPTFRSSKIAAFNLSSIRNSDYSKSYMSSPNGLYAEEICQLAWFAGNSDAISTYSLSCIPETKGHSASDFMIAAQTLWYILTGIAKRYNDDPGKNTCNFKEYYIENNKIPEDIVFYKSIKSGKYWIKYGNEKTFIPCLKKDMDVVLDGDVPDRLLRRIAISQKK